VHEEDALKFIVKALRAGPESVSPGHSYGYDLYLPNVMREYAASEEHINPRTYPSEIEPRVVKLSPTFFSAAWELCRRGIIRPGIARLGAQSTEDGGAGAGYSITSFGHVWLRETHDDVFVPTE